ncbi:MAG: hypothetical protein ABIY40_07800 [Rhodanobacteraceae bacterium]
MRRALEIAAETGDMAGHAHALAVLAALRSDDAADDRDLAMFRQAIAEHELMEDVSRVPWTLTRYGLVLAMRGQLDEAETICARARAAVARLNAPRSKEFALSACAEIELARGKVQVSRALVTQLLTTAKNANDKVMLETALLQQTRFAVAGRGWPQARELLATLIPTAAAENNIADEALAQAWLARCAHGMHDPSPRDHALARARELRRRIGFHADAFQVDLALAQLRGEMGDRDAAVTALQTLANDADRRQWMASALEARLAAFQLLQRSHDPVALTRRSQIETAAHSHGFKWVLARLDAKPNTAIADVPH